MLSEDLSDANARISTILAPVMTPLLMKITAGEIIHVDAVGMFINILIVTIIP